MLVTFWGTITDNISVEFSTAAKGILNQLFSFVSILIASTFLNQTFENDYPKLVQIFSDLLSQVEQLHSQSEPHSQSSMIPFLGSTTPQPVATPSSHRQALLIKSLSQFEKVYTSRSLSRFLDSVNQLFLTPNRGIPREDELSSFVQLLTRLALRLNSFNFDSFPLIIL